MIEESEASRRFFAALDSIKQAASAFYLSVAPSWYLRRRRRQWLKEMPPIIHAGVVWGEL